MRRASLLLVTALGLACGDDATSGGTPTTSGTGAGAAGAGASGSGAGSTGGAPSTTSSGGAASGGAGGAPAFVLSVHTALEGSTLQLLTNLPREAATCAALPVTGAPCEDLDLDGLTDAWEDVVLDRLRPAVILDEDEQLVGDANAVQGIVGRVAPAGGAVRVFMMLGYSKDYGSCGGFTGHNGDSERVALSLVPVLNGDPGDVQIDAAYTAAHEGTSNDHGHVFTGAELSQLTFGNDVTLGEPRWAVYSSADKHATYGSIAICEGVSIIPCFDEDCAPDGVANPADYVRLFPFKNAGEEAHPLLTDLGSLGFPGDDAWATQDFCGGLGGSGCSSAVRDKLLADPF